MTGVQTCALPICFPVTIWHEWIEELEPTSEAFKEVIRCLIGSIVFNLTGMTLEEATKKAEANAALAAQIGAKKKPTGGKK